MANDKRVLRLPAVMERTGLSKASIYRLIHEDDFPSALRNLSTTLRHRRSRFTEPSLLLWM